MPPRAASPARRSPPTPAPQIASDVGALDPQRFLVRTGEMTVTVARGKLPEAAARIVGLTTGYGGYVLTSQISTPDSSAAPYADITVRVPANVYDAAIQRFGALGRVQGVQTSATDVTGQYVDLHARLDQARRVDQRLLGFLARTTTVTEALAVQARIDATELKVEQLAGQLKALREQVTYGTLTVSVTERGAHHVAESPQRLRRRAGGVVATHRRRLRGDRRRSRRHHALRRADRRPGGGRLVCRARHRPPAATRPARAVGQSGRRVEASAGTRPVRMTLRPARKSGTNDANDSGTTPRHTGRSPRRQPCRLPPRRPHHDKGAGNESGAHPRVRRSRRASLRRGRHPCPGPAQVLVRIKAAAVNPVDVAVRRNSFPDTQAAAQDAGLRRRRHRRGRRV